nr:glycosyltransferase [uncultured Blautia sp.]
MDIVMIPFHDYKKWLSEGFRTRDAHLCQHFTERDEIGKILVINRPTSLAEVCLKRINWVTDKGVREYKKNGICLSKMSEKVWCLDFILPDFIKVAKEKKAWWFTAFQYNKVLNGINDAIKYLHLEKSILLLQNPMAIGAAQNVKCDLFAFDAIDNWLYHPQMQDKTLIKKNYNYVDNHADIIFTVSESLKDTFPNNTNVNWIPNGVDIDYFRAARYQYDDCEGKITIGYVGKIQDRVDFELVEKCAQRYSDCEFMFLGPVYSQKEKTVELVRKYKNISFKGDIHYSELPKEMHGMDIAIIPHRVDKFTNSMNPLKIYEYLAAGKLVVSTKVAGIENLSNYVFLADDNEKFINTLGKAIELIKNRKVESEQVAKSIPQECSWEDRTNIFIEKLNCALKD